MSSERNRRCKRDMAAAAVISASGVLAPWALAQSAGTTTPAAVTPSPAPELDVLSVAQRLADDGQLVEARSRLDALARGTGLARMSPADRTRALNLLKDVDARLRTADPMEIGLQKAQAALNTGDAREARRHAEAVASRSFASAAQKTRAATIIEQAQARRDEMAPLVAGMIEQADADFAAGKYAECKSGVLALLRSGVDLTPEQAGRLEGYQLKIVELERSRGETFGVDTQAGLTAVGDDRADAWKARAAEPLPTIQPGSTQPGSTQPASTQPVATALRVETRTVAGAQPAEGGRPGDVEPLPAVQPAGTTQAQAQPEAQPASDASAQPANSDTQYAPMSSQSQPDAGTSGQTGGQPGSQPAAAPAPTSSGLSPTDDLVTLAMRAEAQRLLAEADQSFDQARYARAVDLYTTVLAQFRQYLSTTDADRAERRRAEASQRLGGGLAGGDGLAGQVIQGITLQQQQARAAFSNEVEQARARLAAGDVQRASEMAARARLTITNARSAFGEAEYDGFLKSLDELNREIEARRETLSRDEATRREADLKAKAQQAETNRINDRDRKVNEAIDRVRALQAERKYREALQVVEQALFLDPNDPTALLLRDILRDLTVYERFNETQDRKQYGHATQTLDNEDAMVPPLGLIEYPTEWPAKTFQRGDVGAFTDTPENRRVLASMRGAKIPLQLTDNRFEDVLTFIGKTANLPVDADWESLATVGIDRDTPVTIRLPEVSVEIALNRILGKVSRDETSKASWAIDQGIITIASDEQIRRNVTLVIYNIQDLLFEIPNYVEVPQIDLSSVLQQSGGGGSGQSPFTNDQDNNQRTPEEVEEQRRERIRQIVDIIQQNVDRDGWIDTGGETGRIQELNGSLIITNTPSNHREVVGLLAKLREIRNMQINVETKFLLVNQNWFEQIGFDLDIVFNANSNLVRNAQLQNPNTLPSDFFNFAPAEGQASGLVRSPGGIPITPGSTGQSATVVGGLPAEFSPIGTQQNSIGLTQSLAQGDFAQSVLRNAPALGIAGQFLDDIQVDFLIQATQADQRTVQLTAPRLTFTNGQTANIFVVTQQAFISDLQPIVGDSAVGFDPTVSVVSEGVTLLVEGVVSSDRRYVTMNIDAGVARIDGFATQPVSAVAGGQLVNSAQVNSLVQLPTITVTRIRTTATVPDEGTLLIGGQRLITEVEVETGVPVLSKIPIINRFFTNRIESKEEQTLLILLKPTVLIQSEEEEKAFPGLLESVRTGVPTIR